MRILVTSLGKLGLLLLFCGVSICCSGTKVAERKPVGPQSSASYQPWNMPQPGEMQGQLGGMMQGR